jgi:hypothetical protein
MAMSKRSEKVYMRVLFGYFLKLDPLIGVWLGGDQRTNTTNTHV